jgi:DNA-binding MarR family transcriptional regulator
MNALSEQEVTATDLAALIAGIHRTTRRRIRRDLALEPLTGAQVELLRLAAESPNIGVSAAARELHLAGNSVSTLVNQLVTGGYLVRRPGKADRRVALLGVTEAGRERLDLWADQRARLIAEELRRLAPAELAALESALPALRTLAAGLARQQTAHTEQAAQTTQAAQPVEVGP